MTDEAREYAMESLAVMTITEIAEKENCSQDEAFDRFVRSDTYEKLYDPECGLWMNGPDYITDEYLIENEACSKTERYEVGGYHEI